MEFWWKNSNFNSWIVDRKWIPIKVVLSRFFFKLLLLQEENSHFFFEFSSSVFCWKEWEFQKKFVVLCHIFIHILFLMWNSFLKFQQIVLDSRVRLIYRSRWLIGRYISISQLSDQQITILDWYWIGIGSILDWYWIGWL